MNYTIEYGKRDLKLNVPDRRVIGTLSAKPVKELPNIDAAVKAAIRKPIASPPLETLLKNRKTALIVTVDHTRPSPAKLILPILDLCERNNVKPTVIIATGRHRQMTEAELIRHLGKSIMRRCRILQHDPFDEKIMTGKGRTRRGTPVRVNRVIYEHDVVIGAGFIEPSYLCGWSGGRKLLLPGLAHYRSVDNNHYYLTHPGAKVGRLHGNPISDDAVEFAATLPLHFIVYAVSGPNDEFVRIMAGHRTKAHEQACAYCEKIYKVKGKQADIVISSPGGAPYDCNLVQGKKAIIPAADAVKRNGVVIMCAECPEGLGAEKTFLEWMKNKTPAEVVKDVLDRNQFNLGAHGANILARPIVRKNATLVLVTCPKVARALKGSYVVTTTKLSEAWELANLITGRDSSVLFIEKARRLITS